MKKILLRFAYWILAHYKIRAITVPMELDEAVHKAKALCDDYGSRKDQSGEWKRHQVLARLMKLGYNERDSALSIEFAVRLP
jgi:hypothetical protein